MGAREWLEMGGEKKPLGMSELGCADGCGRLGSRELVEMGGQKKALGMSELGCADGCGRRGCKGVPENGWGDEGAGNKRLGCADADGVCARGWLEMGGEKKVLWMRLGRRRRWAMSELGCADGCGWRGCKGVAGNGEKKPLGTTGRLPTAWVQGSGWKWVEKKAAGDERAWLRGRLRTAWVQGSGWKWVGARGWLGMSELGCADGCGRRGCKGVGGKWVGRRSRWG